jgi:hypothetical protein
MSDKTETKIGTCPTHGSVRAERRMPRPGFPFVVYAFRRLMDRTGRTSVRTAARP